METVRKQTSFLWESMLIVDEMHAFSPNFGEGKLRKPLRKYCSEVQCDVSEFSGVAARADACCVTSESLDAHSGHTALLTSRRAVLTSSQPRRPVPLSWDLASEQHSLS